MSNNIIITQGVPFLCRVYVTAGGSAFSLAGFTATAQMRRELVDQSDGTPDAPLVSFTCTIPTPSTGIVEVSLTSVQTASLLAAAGVWDLMLSNGSTKYRMPYGTATVQRGVTVG
jgi:hypothetical protein